MIDSDYCENGFNNFINSDDNAYEDNCSQESEFPLAVQALGHVRFNSTSQSIENRVSIYEDVVIIDNILCYTKMLTPFAPFPIWVRIPSFFPLVTNETREKFPTVFQINDTNCIGFSSLHGIIIQDQFFPVTTSTKIDRMELSEIEEAKISKAEWSLITNKLGIATELIKSLLETMPLHPRIQFAAGCLALRIGQNIEAKSHFYNAALYGHPDGLWCERNVQAVQNTQARAIEPALFQALANNDYELALSLTPHFIELAPAEGNAIKAQCLKNLSRYEESIKACQASLEADLLQNDVLHLLWGNHITLFQDEAALETAKLHLTLYPTDPQAYTNMMDSYLLLGDIEHAKVYALAYLAQATSYNDALQNLFKFYNTARDWKSLSQFYETLLPFMKNKEERTLINYTETLNEIGEYSKACDTIQTVLSNNPSSIPAVLAYTRALAKSGDLQNAIHLLKTVLHDPSSQGSKAEHLLALTLLSELFRNTGEILKALSLWDSIAPIDINQIFCLAGVRPIVEYAYCLLTVERRSEVIMIFNTISKLAPNDYLVGELKKRLCL